MMENSLLRANESLTLQLKEIEKLHLQLQEQVARDPLAGLYNWRYLTDTMERELARARREQIPVSVAILDLDHFKGINDTFGHECGDVVPKTMAVLLLSYVRANDIACRYGGEEFVLLMPSTPLNAAAERLEELRKAFEATLINYDGKTICATSSFGLASHPAHGDTGESVLRVADDMLYLSKRNGRNRVSVAE
ncbi:MAG: GGDEF domain-containing protein [Thiobacillaceae bacterium]